MPRITATAPLRHHGRMRVSSALAAQPAIGNDVAASMSPPPPQDPPQSGSFAQPHLNEHTHSHSHTHTHSQTHEHHHHHRASASTSAVAALQHSGDGSNAHSARTSPPSAAPQPQPQPQPQHDTHPSHTPSGSSWHAAAAAPHPCSDVDSLSDDALPPRRPGVGGTPPPSAPLTAEDLNATVHALRHENRILRQRVEVLTSSRALQPAGTLEQDEEEAKIASRVDAANGGRRVAATITLAEAPRAVLLARIARLEAAVRLEALERDVVEQRLLAQERVLRALCSSASPPPPAAPHTGPA